MNINLDKNIKKKCHNLGCNFIAWEYCLLTYATVNGHCLKHCGCPVNKFRRQAEINKLRQGRLSLEK